MADVLRFVLGVVVVGLAIWMFSARAAVVGPQVEKIVQGGR